MLGLDLGTSYLITARDVNKSVHYKEFRDAFFKIKPSTPIAAKMIEKGLLQTKYFKDTDGSYVIIGKDAIEKAVERHESVQSPLNKGIISPREVDARRVLKFILKELLGSPASENEKVVYSIPAAPADLNTEDFDIGYHCDALKNDLVELGFNPFPLNEAEAICYSELENDDYTGISASFGAGLVNFCIMSSGEPVLTWSSSKSGDWIDRMAAASSNQPDSVVQMEKEQGIWEIGTTNSNRILDAISIYYVRLIKYTLDMLQYQLVHVTNLPKFNKSIPFVIAGGTSLAKGFIPEVKKQLKEIQFPISIENIRHASDPLRSVSRGCLIASNL